MESLNSLKRFCQKVFDVGDANDPSGRALILARQDALIQQIPIMYVVLLINVLTLMFVTSSWIPVMNLVIPVIMSGIVIQRIAYIRRHGKVRDPVKVAVQQRKMIMRTAVLSIGYAIWVFSVLNGGDITQVVTAAMLAYVSGLGCAFAMAKLPWAARMAVMLATFPVAVKLLSSENHLLVALGANLLLASLLALRLLHSHAEGFTSGIRMRYLLEEEGRRARVAEAKIARLARTDELTGLVNRRGFFEVLNDFVHARNSAFALIVADLNRFKPINDTYGHPAGDKVLVHVAKALNDSVPEGSTVARLGGDEFAMIIPYLDSMRELNAVMRSVDKNIEMPINLYDGVTISASASFGIIIRSKGDCDVNDLMSRADQELYARKRAVVLGGRRAPER